jgi:uncharacterized protein
MGSREFAEGRRVVARLPFGGDLLTEIAAVADRHGIQMAELRAIGALQQARLSYYDQATRAYEEFPVDEPVEMLALVGNVSCRDGATAVHVHATVGRHNGGCLGGHVAPGCPIFACELVMQELLGEPLERGYDEETGLPLWCGL